jgi:hypothetical protein
MMKTAVVAAALTAFIAAEAAAQFQEVPQVGPFRHVGSNTTFPEQVGPYERGKVFRLDDPAGENVAVGYQSQAPGDRVILMEFVYPPQPVGKPSRETACETDFAASKAAIDKYDGSRKLGEPTPPPMAGVPARFSHQASYTFSAEIDGKPVTMQTDVVLYCYVAGNWFVKYRVSTPVGSDLRTPLNQFITAIGPWPGRK